MCIYIFLLNQARKAELDRRQAELDRREEELRNASINGTCYYNLFVCCINVIKTIFMYCFSSPEQLATIT